MIQHFFCCLKNMIFFLKSKNVILFLLKLNFKTFCVFLKKLNVLFKFLNVLFRIRTFNHLQLFKLIKTSCANWIFKIADSLPKIIFWNQRLLPHLLMQNSHLVMRKLLCIADLWINAEVRLEKYLAFLNNALRMLIELIAVYFIQAFYFIKGFLKSLF